jgi:hypothetical protein
MYRQLYPLPIFCFSSAINSKMTKPKRKGKPKTTPPPSPTRAATAKRKTPPKGSNPTTKKAAVALKEAPVPAVPATSKPPSPDTKSPARSSQMSGPVHPVTTVVVQTAGNPNDQEELTTTMEGGGATTDRSASVAYAHLDKKTNNQSAVIAVIRNYVTQHFFQRVKFITSNRKLAYFDAEAHPNTYCTVITKGCNLPSTTNSFNWCESVAKREVRKKMHQLRSDRLTALKWDYFGTY